jgi:4-amino-4-deoxy-L-arabinose transferase-like glycosyltransferase
MSDQRRFELGDLLLLLVVFAVAGGARAWYLAVCAENGLRDGPVQVQDASPLLHQPRLEATAGPLPPLSKEDEATALQTNLNQDRWFGSLAPLAASEEKTAHVAPGYYWLRFWLQLSPVQIGQPEQTLRWLQAALGTLTVVFYFLFALQAFGSRLVAGLTGLLCAVYPFWIANTAELQDGVLTTFLLATTVYFGSSGGRRGGPAASLLFGLGLAGLALVRAALLPFALAALVWFLLRCRLVRRGWLCALLAFLGFANGLASWTFRNFKEFETVVPVADSAFLHLWQGNNALAYGGPQTEEVLVQALARQRGEEPQQTLAKFAELKQPERYEKLAPEVWRSVQADPAAAFNHRLEASISFFLGAKWLEDRTLWRNAKTEHGALPEWLSPCFPALAVGSLFGMLALAALGWRWTYGWRMSTFPTSLALIWVPLPYILGHAEAYQGPRLPLDGVLLCYASFALVCLIPSIGGVLLPGPVNPSTKGERPR